MINESKLNNRMLHLMESGFFGKQKLNEVAVSAPENIKTVKYLDICGYEQTFENLESEAYQEWYYVNWSGGSKKITWDDHNKRYIPYYPSYGLPEKPHEWQIIDLRRKKRCPGYTGRLWNVPLIDWDTVTDFVAIGLEWINPVAAAIVDVAHAASYFWRATNSSGKESDGYLGAGVVTLAFAAIPGALQGFSPIIKAYLRNGGTLISGAIEFAEFLIQNIYSILKGAYQLLQQLLQSPLVERIANSIGCGKAYIASLSGNLDKHVEKVANKLKNNVYGGA